MYRLRHFQVEYKVFHCERIAMNTMNCLHSNCLAATLNMVHFRQVFAAIENDEEVSFARSKIIASIVHCHRYSDIEIHRL